MLNEPILLDFTPTIIDQRVLRRSSYNWQFIYYVGDEGAETPFNFTGCKAKMEIINSADVVVYTFSTNNDTIRFNQPATDGFMKIFMPVSFDWTVLPKGEYNYRLWIEPLQEEAICIIAGKLWIVEVV